LMAVDYEEWARAERDPEKAAHLARMYDQAVASRTKENMMKVVIAVATIIMAGTAFHTPAVAQSCVAQWWRRILF
jgi:hypothetical protein